MTHVLVLAAAYVLGSIPFGLLMGKWWAKVDVRQYGSGNIGMTNVLRTAGLCPRPAHPSRRSGQRSDRGVFGQALLGRTLLEPSGRRLCHGWAQLASVLGFKGGKGVATVAGVLLVFRPLAALVLLTIWLGMLLAFRFISWLPSPWPPVSHLFWPSWGRSGSSLA